MPGEKTIAQQRQTIAVPAGTLRVGRDGPSARIGAEGVVIGRNPSCTLALADPKVSFLHAEVRVQDGAIWVRDRSLNGTYIHGVRVREFELTGPLAFHVGNTRIDFVPEAPSELVSPVGDEFHGLVGGDPAMRLVTQRIQRLATTALSVLILGETGTGKELVARAMHAASPRAKKPCVVVDCGAIPVPLAESILFGHEKGSFTGAIKTQVSPFVEADGGTIFLDELGELPPEIQAKLLRVLAERKVRSLGGKEFKAFDVRIVAATRRDLAAMVNDESFRSDLYFRIAQASIELPPLRARRADVPLLIKRALEDIGEGAAFDRVTDQSLEHATYHHDWPGNVRELRSAVEAAFGLADHGAEIDLSKGILSLATKQKRTQSESKDWSWSASEKEYFRSSSNVGAA
jgi:transcriptional regulator with GAF, ATPase, and Fis domain